MRGGMKAGDSTSGGENARGKAETSVQGEAGLADCLE